MLNGAVPRVDRRQIATCAARVLTAACRIAEWLTMDGKPCCGRRCLLLIGIGSRAAGEPPDDIVSTGADGELDELDG